MNKIYNILGHIRGKYNNSVSLEIKKAAEEINWEQRKFEISKEALRIAYEAKKDIKKGTANPDEVVRYAVKYANKLIKEYQDEENKKLYKSFDGNDYYVVDEKFMMSLREILDFVRHYTELSEPMFFHVDEIVFGMRHVAKLNIPVYDLKHILDRLPPSIEDGKYYLFIERVKDKSSGEYAYRISYSSETMDETSVSFVDEDFVSAASQMFKWCSENGHVNTEYEEEQRARRC